MLRLFSALAVMLFASPAAAQTFDLAPIAASELDQACRQDAGAMWGADFCGPLLLVDPGTRQVWASRADTQGRLRPGSGGWIGALPPEAALDGPALSWAGVNWIAIAEPLPDNATDRRVLLIREASRRARAAIGAAPVAPACPYLDEPQARILLRLEMRALATALRSASRARERAAQEALMFRATRLMLYESAPACEAGADRDLGLAAFTGVGLGAEAPLPYAARVLDRFDSHTTSFTASYAIATGPAYGLLLDDVRPSWRSEARLGAVPADLLTAIIRPQLDSNRRLNQASDRYGGDAIAQEEANRADDQRRRAETQTSFTRGPRLEVTLLAPQIEYSGERVPIEGAGTIYEALTIRDDWGTARATAGALISADSRRLVLAAPTAGGLSGPGWALSLAEGYQIAGPGPDGAFWIENAPPAP